MTTLWRWLCFLAFHRSDHRSMRKGSRPFTIIERSNPSAFHRMNTSSRARRRHAAGKSAAASTLHTSAAPIKLHAGEPRRTNANCGKSRSLSLHSQNRASSTVRSSLYSNGFTKLRVRTKKSKTRTFPPASSSAEPRGQFRAAPKMQIIRTIPSWPL